MKKALMLGIISLYFLSCNAQSNLDTLVYVDTTTYNQLKNSYDSLLGEFNKLSNVPSFTPDTIINKVDTSYIKLINLDNNGYILINRKNPVNYIHIVEGNVRNAITWNGYSHTLQIMVQDSTNTIWNNNYSIDKLINCY